MIVSILCTYGTLLGAMGYHSVQQADTYGDFHFVSMLAWLFVFQQAAALLFALDFVQLLFLLPTLWAMHVATSCYIWRTAVAEPQGVTFESVHIVYVMYVSALIDVQPVLVS